MALSWTLLEASISRDIQRCLQHSLIDSNVNIASKSFRICHPFKIIEESQDVKSYDLGYCSNLKGVVAK